MPNRIIYYIILSIILIILAFPTLQRTFSVFEIEKLNGYFVETKKDSFTVKNWLNGSYQENRISYYNEKFGLYPFFVRLHNQLNYYLFNDVSARGIVVGEENYLYEENYIKAYYGADFLGKNIIDEKVKKISVINDSLRFYNIDIIVAFAAGKGSFYPEYFPKEERNKKKKITNQDYYKEKLKEYRINFIDFNDWFQKSKDTSQYKLYPKYGIHWSYYGIVKTADSLIRYVEDLKKIDLPNIEITEIELDKKLKYTDYDIGEALNLFFQLSTEPMAYPKFHWTDDSTTTKPKVLVIADSFYWGLYNLGLGTNSFDTGGFWYYFEHAYPEDKPLKSLNLKKKILEQQVIILLGSEATFDRFPYGFIEQTYSLFHETNN